MYGLFPFCTVCKVTQGWTWWSEPPFQNLNEFESLQDIIPWIPVQRKLCKHQLGAATLPFLVYPKHPKCALGMLQSCFTSCFVFQDTEMPQTAWGEGREVGGRQAAARPATILPCCHRPVPICGRDLAQREALGWEWRATKYTNTTCNCSLANLS